MSLLTLDQIKQLIANGFAQRAREDDGEDPIDFPPLVKLFTPDAQCLPAQIPGRSRNPC